MLQSLVLSMQFEFWVCLTWSAASLAFYCSPLGNTSSVCPMKSQLPLTLAKFPNMFPNEEDVQPAIRQHSLLAHSTGLMSVNS